jgi:hypothetical protein
MSQLSEVLAEKEEEKRLKEFLQVISNDFKKKRHKGCFEKINSNINLG